MMTAKMIAETSMTPAGAALPSMPMTPVTASISSDGSTIMVPRVVSR